jgi:hypothetical protein
MARSEGAEGPAQHLADAIAAAFARTEQPGEHLAVHAPKLGRAAISESLAQDASGQQEVSP